MSAQMEWLTFFSDWSTDLHYWWCRVGPAFQSERPERWTEPYQHDRRIRTLHEIATQNRQDDGTGQGFRDWKEEENGNDDGWGKDRTSRFTCEYTL